MISTVSLRPLSSPTTPHNLALPDLNSKSTTTACNGDVSFCFTSKNNHDGQTTSLSQSETSEKQSTSSSDSTGIRIKLKLHTESLDAVAVAVAVAVACDDDKTLPEGSCRKESERVDETSEKKTPVEEEERKKPSSRTFSIALMREKIEADLLAMSGGSKRLSRRRRMKKRAKRGAQRELDRLFPCLRSKFISPEEDYRVRDHSL